MDVKATKNKKSTIAIILTNTTKQDMIIAMIIAMKIGMIAAAVGIMIDVVAMKIMTLDAVVGIMIDVVAMKIVTLDAVVGIMIDVVAMKIVTLDAVVGIMIDVVAMKMDMTLDAVEVTLDAGLDAVGMTIDMEETTPADPILKSEDLGVTIDIETIKLLQCSEDFFSFLLMRNTKTFISIYKSICFFIYFACK